MSTRRADPNAPLSQERYMSSPEFSELHGISGTAAAKRCALLGSAAQGELLWFIQGLSLLKGGLNDLAEGLLSMFPERIGTRTMHELGQGHQKRYSAKQAAEIEAELYSTCESELISRSFGDPSELLNDWETGRIDRPVRVMGPHISWQVLFEKCRTEAREQLPDFLTMLCINPALSVNDSGASVAYFQDVIGALFEYKRCYEERARAEFCQTAIGRQIWKQLDDALRSKTMIVIDGLEGRGKTEAVRAWCDCHLGVARFVSLDGTSTKTTQFREMARALGVGHGYTSKVSEMQSKVKDVVRASQLMLVVDEAHFCFNNGPRMYTRPEMLDWIDTALCNPPLPLALITTPQFMICMERAADQVGWNYRQFKRRCKRYCRLPAKNTPEDIEVVARHLFSGADRATIKLVLAYEALSNRDLSAVGDVAREARLIAEKEGASKISFEHVRRAIHEVLIVSDLPWAEMEKRLREKRRGGKAIPEAAVPAPEPAQDPSMPQERQIAPRLLPDSGSGNRLRFQQSEARLVEAAG